MKIRFVFINLIVFLSLKSSYNPDLSKQGLQDLNKFYFEARKNLEDRNYHDAASNLVKATRDYDYNFSEFHAVAEHYIELMRMGVYGPEAKTEIKKLNFEYFDSKAQSEFIKAMIDFNKLNYKAAYKNFLSLAANGYAPAQYMVGMMHYKGFIYPQDYRKLCFAKISGKITISICTISTRSNI